MTSPLEPYPEFLAKKHIRAQPVGFEPRAPHPRLFGFQQAAWRFGVRAGRAALLCETGTGKTTMEIAWANEIAAHTGGRVLLLAPLAVAFQFIDEARQLDTQLVYARSQAEADSSDVPLVITNYELLDRFDLSQFVGVALDESSILANYTGKTKQRLVEGFKNTRYKLAASATPAPNDWMELLNQSEFLGIMPAHEAISKWFTNDTMNAGKYRLRGHSAGKFWEWVASWAVCITHPRDVGFDDAGYDLPALQITQHTVQVDHTRAWEHPDRTGQSKMFVDDKQSATGMWREKADTINERCALAATLVNAERNEPWIVWASTDDESKRLVALIPGAVEVKGSHKPEEKERRIKGFIDGSIRVLVTKTKIAAQGLNFQHCARMCFVSPTFSWKDAYQGIRRIYRFRQSRACQVHFVLAETEQNIYAAIQQKDAQHHAMQQAMTAAMKVSGLLAQERDNAPRAYQPTVQIELPAWLRAA